MCTRVLWNTNQVAVVAGRSMDWPTTTEPKLTVWPRGAERDGGLLAGHRIDVPNPLTWTSVHGSVVVSIYGVGSIDGMNERGLAVHALYLGACDFGVPAPDTQSVHAGLWLQAPLDLCATVAEAVELLGGLGVVPVEINGHRSNLHLALEDATGDSAVVEFVDGRLSIHHGREHVVMTNDPIYDEQLQLLAEQDFSEPSRDMPLPGNVNARDRFQRAAYYHALLPEPTNVREAVSGVLAIVRNCSVPFGAPYGEFGVYNTEYRTVADVTNGRYFLELTTSPNVLWVDLASLDLSAGAPVLVLDPDDLTLSGEVSTRFEAVAGSPY
jgi:penicillin V acylase-like amidase (Ntn superfamily)